MIIKIKFFCIKIFIMIFQNTPTYLFMCTISLNDKSLCLVLTLASKATQSPHHRKCLEARGNTSNEQSKTFPFTNLCTSLLFRDKKNI